MGNWTTLEHEALRHVSGDFEEATHHLAMADGPQVVEAGAGSLGPGGAGRTRGLRPSVVAGPASPLKRTTRARPNLRIV